MARFFNPIPQYLDGSARVLPGAKIYFYENGTTTPQATYSNAALSVANANPVICDANGRVTPIFVPDDDVYTVVFTDTNDVQFATIDDFVGADGNVSAADVVAALAANTAALTINGASITLTPATTVTGALTANGGITTTTLQVTADTSSGDSAALGYTATEGVILTGQGSTSAVTIKNDADATVASIPTGTTTFAMAGAATIAGITTLNGTARIAGAFAGHPSGQSYGAAFWDSTSGLVFSGDTGSSGDTHRFTDENGGTTLALDSDNESTFYGDVDPSTTESFDLGSASLEWDNLFVQNSPTVSDERQKNDLGSASDYVPVLKLLDPRIFSRKSKVVKEAVLANTKEVPKTETVEKDFIDIIDGVPTLVTKPVQQEVVEHKPVLDADGNQVTRPILDKDGKPTGKVEAVTHPVPIMVTVDVPAEPEKLVEHGRPHTGFMAQKVKEAMEKAGVSDWAGYAYDEGSDTHMLRLQEFISPILAYCQELDTRLQELEK